MQQVQDLTAQDILSLAQSELIGKASLCGIDWLKASQLINGSSGTIKNGIELEKKYRGGIAVLYDLTRKTKSGQPYPNITFRTVKHSEIQEVFKGNDWLFENGYFSKKTDYKLPRKSSTTLLPRPPVAKTIPCKCCSIHFVPDEPWKNTCEYCYKLERFNKFKVDFEAMQFIEDATLTKYLIDKDLKSRDIPTNFLKVGNDKHGEFIAFKLQSIEGNTTGFQKIYSDRKEFVFYPLKDKSGKFDGTLKQGSYALLGKLDGKHVYFSEGLTTALSVHNATKRTTVICLDAGNLEPVLGKFKQANIGRRVIAADNDINSKGGNVGVYAAIKAASKHKARVFVSWFGNGVKCDFDDVRKGDGIERVAEQLKTRLNEFEITDFNDLNLLNFAPIQQIKKLALSICYELSRQSISKDIQTPLNKLIQILNGRSFTFDNKQTAADVIASMTRKAIQPVKEYNEITNKDGLNVIEFDGDKPMESIAHHILSNGGVYIDDGKMGTGKTELMGLISRKIKKLSESQGKREQVTYIAHRVALIISACERLELRYYDDVQAEFGERAQWLGVTANSLPKHDVSQNVDILFCDEIRQTLEHMLNGPVHDRSGVYDEFIRTINSAKTVVFSDADMNDFTIQWLKDNLNKPLNHIVRTKKHTADKTIQILPSGKNPHHTNIKQAYDAVRDSKNVLMCSDTAIQATKAYDFLINQGIPDKDILLLTGKNKDDTRQDAFLKNPNKEAIKYKCVIYSPVISSGISIEVKHFDHVRAMISGVLPENELLQQVGRYRSDVVVYASFAVHNKSRSICTNDLMSGEQTKRGRYDDGAGTLQLTEMDRVAIHAQSNLNKSLNDVKNRFLILAKLRGYKVKYAGANDAAIEIQGLNKLVKEKRINQVIESESITNNDVHELEKRTALKQSESDSLDKFNAGVMSGQQAEELTADDVDLFLNDNGMSKVINYELVHDDPDLLYAKKSDKDNHATRREQTSKTSMAFIFRQIIELMVGKELNTVSAGIVCETLTTHHKELSANGFQSYKHKSKSPIRTIGGFIEKCGYEIEESSRRRIGGIVTRFYTIKPMENIEKYYQRRKITKTATDTET